MKRWRIVEIPPDEVRKTDLTNGELIGISILLTHRCGEPRNDSNVYWRAREKIQTEVEVALDDDD